MKAGITERERPVQAPSGTPHPLPLLWLSIGDSAVGYFAGEVTVRLAGSIAERRRETARALRALADVFDGAA